MLSSKRKILKSYLAGGNVLLEQYFFITMQLKIDSQKRASEFFDSFRDCDNIYVLFDKSDDGTLATYPAYDFYTCKLHGLIDVNSNSQQCECPDSNINDMYVVPIWSEKYKAYGNRLDQDTTVLHSIDRDVFLNDLLQFLIRNEYCIGINWNQKGAGVEVLAKDLYQRLIQE